MKPGSVYRCFDHDGALLYVGVSVNAIQRIGQHQSEKKPWFHEVARVEIEHFESRLLAAEAEVAAIQNERPAYNIKDADPVRRAQLQEEREARDARFREELAAKQEQRRAENRWVTNGKVVCVNCGRRPETFPKGSPVGQIKCLGCGCDGTYINEDFAAIPEPAVEPKVAA